jgi:2'-5' RNA ligase
MRAFIAIYPDQKFCEQASIVLERLARYTGLKPTPIHQLHLTVKFLGEDLEEQQINLISRNLQSKIQDFRPFILQSVGIRFGFANNENNPQYLFIKIRENKNLSDLVDLTDSLLPNISREHDFLPHLTLARTQRKFDLKELKSINRTIQDSRFQKPFLVDKISFIQSTLKKEGPVHRRVGNVKLE